MLQKFIIIGNCCCSAALIKIIMVIDLYFRLEVPLPWYIQWAWLGSRNVISADRFQWKRFQKSGSRTPSKFIRIPDLPCANSAESCYEALSNRDSNAKVCLDFDIMTIKFPVLFSVVTSCKNDIFCSVRNYNHLFSLSFSVSPEVCQESKYLDIIIGFYIPMECRFLDACVYIFLQSEDWLNALESC